MEDEQARPSRGVWIAWTLALVGGLAVLAGVVVALRHPCLQDGRTLASASCADAIGPTLVTVLAGGGTAVAIVGGVAATILTLRRPRADAST